MLRQETNPVLNDPKALFDNETVKLESNGAEAPLDLSQKSSKKRREFSLDSIEPSPSVTRTLSDSSEKLTRKFSKKGKKLHVASSGDCICNQLTADKSASFMIQCSGCQKWFHGECLRITERQSESIEEYHCAACVPTRGPTTKKPKTNTHRHNAYELDAHNKPMQAGTLKFIKGLLYRKYAPVEEVLVIKKGREVTIEWLKETGFVSPVLVRERWGLDIKIPDEPFGYDDVVRILGDTREVLAIDVPTQEDGTKVVLKDYLDYMKKPPESRDTVLNIISLEFTNTPMADRVEPPLVIKDLSWSDRFFPEKTDLPPESPYAKPEVQKYCLMSAKDSYTDFHIDFAGTSVWYHIFKGKKVFLLIAPTPENLKAYEEWMKSAKQSEMFLGNKCRCYWLELNQGETILMPSGWIHAVYTPEDSLVFGGNFLHHLAVETQLKVVRMEERLNTPDRYRYPHFFTACWYALNDLTELLAEAVEEKKQPPDYVVRACRCLHREFLSWMRDDEAAKEKCYEIPETVDAKAIMRKLTKYLKKIP